MGLHLYCIGPSRHRPPADLRGLDGAPVTSVELAPFTLWTSAVGDPPASSLERLRQHDRVVRVATEDVTPLPARFGQWFATREALVARIEERGEAYRRALREVRGTAELVVQVLAPDRAGSPDPDPDRAESGRAYLAALARQDATEREARRQCEETAARLADWLGPLVLRQRVEAGPAPLLARIAHLVRRSDGARYRRDVRAFERAHPEPRLRASGPWPPYSFVS